MRIGFDAKWFFSGNPSGRVIVRNVLEHWLRDHPEHHYVLFLKKEDRFRLFPYDQSNLSREYIGGHSNLLANLFWLPLRARRLALDVCLCFNFLPLFGSYRKLVFINDVIFLSHPHFFTWREKLYFLPMRFMARRADRVCTISQSEERRMKGLRFCPGEKIAVVPNGVSSRYLPRECQALDALEEVRWRYRLPERFLLYLGRLNDRKNILNLLRSLPLSKAGLPLVLAGGLDWKMFDLESAIAELGLGERVTCLGAIPEERMPALYALATLFCYISFAEGFGLPPLEAMASGVPVVVSRIDALSEVCAEAGNYVDPDDPRAIAAMIDRLLTDADLYRRKREMGLARARQFSWRDSADRLLEICLETAR